MTKRSRSGSIHNQIESTGIIAIRPITAEISDITAIQIRIIEPVCCAFLLDNISIVRHPCFCYKYIKRAETRPNEAEAEGDTIKEKAPASTPYDQ